MFLADDNEWLGDETSQEPVEFEPLVESDEPADETVANPAKADVIGILPIRNTVAYPGTIIPLAVGRERSKSLLVEAEPNATVIGLLTQRDPEIEKPGFDDLYSIVS